MCNKIINGTLLQHPAVQPTYKLFDSPLVPSAVTLIYRLAIHSLNADEPLSQFQYCSNKTDSNHCLSESEEYDNYFLSKKVTKEENISKFVITDLLDSEESKELEYNFSKQLSLTCKDNDAGSISWEIEFLKHLDFDEKSEVRYRATIDAGSSNLSVCSESIEIDGAEDTSANDCKLPLIEQFIKIPAPEDTSKIEEEISEKASSENESPTPESPTPENSSRFSSKHMVLGGLGAACAAYIAAKKFFSSKKPETPKQASSQKPYLR